MKRCLRVLVSLQCVTPHSNVCDLKDRMKCLSVPVLNVKACTFLFPPFMLMLIRFDQSSNIQCYDKMSFNKNQNRCFT